MPKLIFEIWHDPTNSSFEMGAVCSSTDEHRRAVSPNAVRIHQFTAESSLDAFQQDYDFHGLGIYRLPDGEREYFYTQHEAEEQMRYIAVRKL
ncbi:hypothetical protein K3165_13900 [Qipengyuania sp. 1XM1-15A]|uniref:hypothetical protein n=1 Tax=Qipengyuania xiamenensis TaxID=2867237 RepID=UPI001C86DA86|nr:hypothetical protein [Qipengyuania xiamenensis]MBX7534024.1 hypothetical protein [Qipengyuania xiamenensis]